MTSPQMFLSNAQWARECGFDLLCAQCGCGMDADDFGNADNHESRCPNIGRDPDAEQLDFMRERLGADKVDEALKEALKEAGM